MENNIIYFSDYIEIITDTYETILYSPIYSSELGLYLSKEDDRPIKEILLIDSKLTIHYLDGEEKEINKMAMSIMVEENLFRKRMKNTISGNLFKYDKKDALIYNLDMTKALDYEVMKPFKKKKSL